MDLHRAPGKPGHWHHVKVVIYLILAVPESEPPLLSVQEMLISSPLLPPSNLKAMYGFLETAVLKFASEYHLDRRGSTTFEEGA